MKIWIDEYINKVMEKLNWTEVWCANSKKNLGYNEGINLLIDTFTKHKKLKSQLFFIGNGGSAAIASHMTADYLKNGGMKTYSLYDHSVITCMGNDHGYEYIFSRPLEFLGREDDLLIAISSSGKSLNIINAIKMAKEKGMSVITFTGFEPDNKVKQLGSINVYVPCKEYGIVESIHNLILQQIVDLIVERDGVGLC